MGFFKRLAEGVATGGGSEVYRAATGDDMVDDATGLVKGVKNAALPPVPDRVPQRTVITPQADPGGALATAALTRASETQGRAAPQMNRVQLGPTQQADTKTATATQAGPVAQVFGRGYVAQQAAPTQRAVAAGISTPAAAQAHTMDAAKVDMSGQAAMQGTQSALASTIMNRVNGNAPSVAELQQKRQIEQNTGRLAGMAASYRGARAGSNLSALLDKQAESNNSIAGNSAELRAKEQESAEGALAGLTTNARQQDIDVAKENAGFQQGAGQVNTTGANDMERFNAGQRTTVDLARAGMETDVSKANAGESGVTNRFNAGQGNDAGQFTAGAQNRADETNAGAANHRDEFNAGEATDVSKFNAGQGNDVGKFNAGQGNDMTKEQGTLDQRTGEENLGAKETTTAQNDAAYGKSMDQAIGVRGHDADLASTAEGQRTTQNDAAMGDVQGERDQAIKSRSETAKSGLDAAGKGLAALSDRRAKKNVSDASEGIDSALSKLIPKEYEYKSPADGTGKRPGIMAQDAEKSRLGREMVTTDGSGRKVIDGSKGLGFLMASVSRLNKRLDRVEKSGRR